jgi:hypothetical protein
MTKTNPDGTRTTFPKCTPNPALKTLQTEIAEVKAKLADIESAQKRARTDLSKYDEHPLDDAVRKAENDYREAIYQSPLHSYTAMLFNKDPQEVSLKAKSRRLNGT